MKQIFRFRPSALALAAAIVLSACGGGGGDHESSGPSQPSAALESAPVGGVLTSVLCNYIAAEELIYVGGVRPRLGEPDQRTVTGEQCLEAQGGGYAAIVDLVLFDKDGAPIDFTPDETSFTEQRHTEEVEPFLTFVGHTKVTTPGKAGAYSAFLAFDQSGSISSSDPSNQRIAAGTLFLQKNAAPDEVALGYFPGSGGALNYVAPTQQDVFSSDTSQHIKYLQSLEGKQGGGTPLYNALVASIDLTVKHASRPNKAVVAFSDGKDTESSWSLDGVVASAKNAGIPLYMFALAGADQDFVAMQQLATGTGGAMLYASSARQLMAAYGSLGNLLRGNVPVYRLVIKSRGVVQTSEICKDAADGPVRTCNQLFDIMAHTPAGDIPVTVNFSVAVRTEP